MSNSISSLILVAHSIEIVLLVHYSVAHQWPYEYVVHMKFAY